MKVTLIPSPASSANPFLRLLEDALVRAGAQVEPAARRADVVNVHWPDLYAASRSSVKSWLRSLAFAVRIAVARSSGAKVVWTVHNLRSHDQLHPSLERRLMRWFAGRVHAWISLSEAAVPAVVAAYPALGGVTHAVVPHGHYRTAYPRTADRAGARRRLRLDPDHRVLLFLGHLRRYKGVDTLLETFAQLPDGDARLLVAGSSRDPAYLSRLRALAGDPRVRLVPGFVADDAVADHLRAADLVVLPYHELLNSGAALLALSFERPVLAPRAPALAELQDEVGAAWLRLYDGPLTAGVLAEALTGATQAESLQPPDLDRRDWTEVAVATLAVFASVACTPRPDG